MVSMFIARSFEVIDGKGSFNDKEVFISLTWCNVIKASDIELHDLFRNNILYTDQTIDFLPLSLGIPNIGFSKASHVVRNTLPAQMAINLLDVLLYIGKDKREGRRRQI